MNSSKKELFESMPVPRALAKLAVPTIISQLISLIYNIVDTFFIGRTGNSYMMAAVTLAFTLFVMTTAFSNLFGIGGGSLIARLSGVYDEKNARKVAALSVYGAIGSALIYSAVVGIFMSPILNLLGASTDTIGFAKQYLYLVVVAGNLPVILSVTLAHLLRNVGYSRQASLGLSGGGILNIILDPIFMFVVFPKGMEVFGAALATLIANIISCIYLLTVVKKVSKKAPLSISLKEIKGIRKEDVNSLFSVGVPSAALTGLFDIANIFLNALMAAHGDLELAAIGIVMKAERLPNAINLGICQGMLPIVAYNYTSGNHKRMQSTVKMARISGLFVCIVCIAMFQLLASPIVHVFMSTTAGDAESALITVELAVIFLRIRCLASPFQFINYHSSFCLQAMGDGRDTLIHSCVRELVFYIPFMYLFNSMFGKFGLVGSVIAGEGCGALFALLILKLCTKKYLSNKK